MDMMRLHFFTCKNILMGVLLLTFSIPTLAGAHEISYGFVKSTRGEAEVHIEYKGPGGEDHFACNVKNATCKKFDSKTNPFRPSDALGSVPITSPDAKYAVFPLSTVGTGNYALLSLSGGTPLALPSLPDTIKRIYGHLIASGLFLLVRKMYLHTIFLQRNF